MTIYYFMAVTGFVTGLMALVGFLSDWWYNDRHWKRVLSRADEALRKSNADTREALHAFEIQQQINKAMADDLKQLRTYRRHHSLRLRELEDVILKLNEDASGVRYRFDDGHAVKITASINAAQPERSVGVRSHELEHTQPLPVVPGLADKIGAGAATQFTEFLHTTEQMVLPPPAPAWKRAQWGAAGPDEQAAQHVNRERLP